MRQARQIVRWASAEVDGVIAGADMMRAAAKAAKETAAEIDMAELRIRAERRVGGIMRLQREAGMLASGGQPFQATGSESDPVGRPITLAEAGITKHLADRARRLFGRLFAHHKPPLAEIHGQDQLQMREVFHDLAAVRAVAQGAGNPFHALGQVVQRIELQR